MSEIHDPNYQLYHWTEDGRCVLGPEPEMCTICGADLEWQSCPDCGGDGIYDAYELDPMWYGPGDTERCSVCDGEGGWLACPNADTPGHGKASR